jgi:hypothetical protein
VAQLAQFATVHCSQANDAVNLNPVLQNLQLVVDPSAHWWQLMALQVFVHVLEIVSGLP